MATQLRDPLPQTVLPPGVSSRIVSGVGDLDMHVLEAGEPSSSAGTILLLHGFPELAFCWRRIMPLLADRGYHVIAPDQRGYGRTTSAPVSHSDPLEPYALTNLAGDVVTLIGALNLDGVDAVIGHDFGSLVAGTCALARPDLFRRLVMLGTPFAGAPALGTRPGPPPADDPIHTALAALPEARRHYLVYYASVGANADMWHCPQGVAAMLRGYYHHKSVDWLGNHPHPLGGSSADRLAQMPSYYVMPVQRTMAQIAAEHMPSAEHVRACTWLSHADLAVVAEEFVRTGFQGGLNWYRSAMRGDMARGLGLFAGARVECPTLFLAGEGDWAAYQTPGAIETMSARLAWEPIVPRFIASAGHWVQQEQPLAVANALADFLAKPTGRPHPA